MREISIAEKIFIEAEKDLSSAVDIAIKAKLMCIEEYFQITDSMHQRFLFVKEMFPYSCNESLMKFACNWKKPVRI